MADSNATTIVIKGIPPYDGEYKLDMSTRTPSNGMLRLIKEVSGYTWFEYPTAWARLDTDFFVALAIAAVTQTGVHVNRQAFWDAPVDAITLIPPTEEGDAVPPPVNSGEKPTSSGDSSANGSENPETTTPLDTGHHYLDSLG